MGGPGVAAMLGLQAGGAYMTAQGQLARAKYAKQIADINAKTALARGDAEASQLAATGTQVVGKQKAGFAASGVDVQSGSVLDVLSSTRMLNKQDIERTKYNAKVTATNYEAQGQMAELEGQYAAMSTYLGAASQGATSAYGAGGFPKFGQ